MRIGCCVNMLKTADDPTGSSYIGKLKPLGFDYVELPVVESTALPEGAFQDLLELIDKAGIPCEGCNNIFPPDLKLVGPDVRKDDIAAYVDKAFVRMKRLGISVVSFGSGSSRSIPAGFSPEAAKEQIVDLLKYLAPRAADNNIMVVIEPLRKQECNWINTFEIGCELAERVNHPNIRVLVDVYHFLVENDSLAFLRENGRKYLSHAHIAFPEGRAFPSENDWADYAAFGKIFREIGYDARISGEAYAKDFEKDGEKAVHVIRKVFC